jgi:hypothetical protein
LFVRSHESTQFAEIKNPVGALKTLLVRKDGVELSSVTSQPVSRSGFDFRKVSGTSECMDPGGWDQQARQAATFSYVPFGQNYCSPRVAAMFSGQLHSSQAF